MKRIKTIKALISVCAMLLLLFGVPSISEAAGRTLTVKGTYITIHKKVDEIGSFIEIDTDKNPRNQNNLPTYTWHGELSRMAKMLLNQTVNETILVYIGMDEQGNVVFDESQRIYGTEGSPIPINLDYDMVIFENTDLKVPFYFEILPDANGMHIGKYMIEEKATENRIIFTRLETSNDPHAFKVTPNIKKAGTNYLQAGAMIEENYEEFGYTPPMYKIEAYEMIWKDSINSITGEELKWWKYTKPQYNTSNYLQYYRLRALYEFIGSSIFDGMLRYKVNECTLGNSHLPSSGTLSNSKGIASATYPSVYVFSAPNIGNAVYAEPGLQADGEITIQGSETAEREKIQDFIKDVGTRDVTIVYKYHGASSETIASEVTGIEETISKVFISIGDLFMKLFQKAFGTDVSIDGVIFNEYTPTIVDFFTAGGAGAYNSLMKTIINNWFKVLRAFTVAALIVVLVAMGIRMILLSDKADMRKIMSMFFGWIMAVGILFIGPYGMKYIIEINDTIVNTLRENRKHALYSVYNYDLRRVGLTTIDVTEGDVEYQIGEDSETTFIAQLLKYKEQLNNSYASIKQGNTNRKAALNNLINNVLGRDRSDYSISVYGKNGGRGLDYRTVFIRIEAGINSGMSVEEVLDTFASKIEVKNRNSNENQDDPEYIDYSGVVKYRLQNTYRAYAEQYLEMHAEQEDIKKIDKAVALVEKNADLIGSMREKAGETHRFLLVLIWYILMFQLVLLVILYYKRLITVAILIVIFPLVMLFYAIEKLMGVEKSKVLQTWITEYMVNILIQSVHALLYVILIDTSIGIFEADNDNWLLFLFAVMAIFPMEAIVKSITGVTGASTVKDLKDSAKKMLPYAIAAGAIIGARGKFSDMKKVNEAKDAKVAQKRERRDNVRKWVAQTRDNHTATHRTDAATVIASRNAKREAHNEKRIQRRNTIDRMRHTGAYALQGIKNVQGHAGAFTSGIAGGGTPEAFKQGAIAPGMLAGKGRSLGDTPATTTNAYENSSSSVTSYANSSLYSGGSRVTGQSGNRYATATAPSSTPVSTPSSGGTGTPNSSSSRMNTASSRSSANSNKQKSKTSNRSRRRVEQAARQAKKSTTYRTNTNMYNS